MRLRLRKLSLQSLILRLPPPWRMASLSSCTGKLVSSWLHRMQSGAVLPRHPPHLSLGASGLKPSEAVRPAILPGHPPPHPRCRAILMGHPPPDPHCRASRVAAGVRVPLTPTLARVPALTAVLTATPTPTLRLMARSWAAHGSTSERLVRDGMRAKARARVAEGMAPGAEARRGPPGG